MGFWLMELKFKFCVVYLNAAHGLIMKRVDLIGKWVFITQ